MKKQVVALLVAILMVLTTMNAFAEETDTDYSYLEDMSVKELRKLRDKINELLGEESPGSQTQAETEFPSTDENGYELSTSEEHYKMAIESVSQLKYSLKNPSSLEVQSVKYSYRPDDKEGDVHNFFIMYSGTNGFGARMDDAYLTSFSASKVMTMHGNWGDGSSIVRLMGEKELNVDFILANLD